MALLIHHLGEFVAVAVSSARSNFAPFFVYNRIEVNPFYFQTFNLRFKIILVIMIVYPRASFTWTTHAKHSALIGCSSWSLMAYTPLQSLEIQPPDCVALGWRVCPLLPYSDANEQPRDRCCSHGHRLWWKRNCVSPLCIFHDVICINNFMRHPLELKRFPLNFMKMLFKTEQIHVRLC